MWWGGSVKRSPSVIVPPAEVVSVKSRPSSLGNPLAINALIFERIFVCKARRQQRERCQRHDPKQMTMALHLIATLVFSKIRIPGIDLIPSLIAAAMIFSSGVM